MSHSDTSIDYMKDWYVAHHWVKTMKITIGLNSGSQAHQLLHGAYCSREVVVTSWVGWMDESGLLH